MHIKDMYLPQGLKCLQNDTGKNEVNHCYETNNLLFDGTSLKP